MRHCIASVLRAAAIIPGAYIFYFIGGMGIMGWTAVAPLIAAYYELKEGKSPFTSLGFWLFVNVPILSCIYRKWHASDVQLLAKIYFASVIGWIIIELIWKPTKNMV